MGSNEKFSLVLLQITNYIYTVLEKCEKKCNMIKIILVQGFCPLNLKITQFPGGFYLNVNVNVSVTVYNFLVSSPFYNFPSATVE